MAEWWGNLEAINKVFYGLAAFFSVLFLWQFLATLIGLAGESDMDAGGDVDVDVDVDVDADVDTTYDQFEHGAEADAGETLIAFKLLSIRSIIAFFTLFSWAGALYLNNGETLSMALLYGIIWGTAAMLVVAAMLMWMRKLTETGNLDLASCIGTVGEVYLDIPEGGVGEVRVTVSGRVSYVKARAVGAAALPSRTMIRVVRRLDQATVEVKPTEEDAQKKGVDHE